jgi:hypothetical protein
MPLLELRMRTIARYDDSAWILEDGVIVDPGPYFRPFSPVETIPAFHLQIPSDDAVLVEVVGPSELSVTNWITEAEQKLYSGGRTAPL